MKRKVARIITGLLCVAIVFFYVTSMRVFAGEEDGVGKETQMQESALGNDTGGKGEELVETGQETVKSSTELEKEIAEETGDPADENQEEDGEENEKPEEDTEIVPKDREEETEPMPEDSVAGESEGAVAGTVSENTAEAETEEETVPAGMFFSVQAYSAGESFTVDGKTYNSLDADETYTAGADITAYYFAADSLLYFDGTGEMEWEGYFVPWYHIYPERCVIGEGITTVGAQAFYWPNHSLKSVVLPDTLRMIKERAFYQCAELETIDLPDGLESIGKEAFLGCHRISSIDIPESVT